MKYLNVGDDNCVEPDNDKMIIKDDKDTNNIYMQFCFKQENDGSVCSEMTMMSEKPKVLLWCKCSLSLSHSFVSL